jgi:hypothetical protein
MSLKFYIYIERHLLNIMLQSSLKADAQLVKNSVPFMNPILSLLNPVHILTPYFFDPF